MDVYQTEEEQIEAIKKWWRDNGTSMVVGVVIALSAVFGWKSWQKHGAEGAERASVAYESVVEAVQNAENSGDTSSIENTTVTHLGEKMLEEHQDTTYSQLAALLLAKHAVEKEDLSGAATHLQWAIDNTDDESIRMVAKLRLAKVLLAQDNGDEALTLLDSEKVPAFEAAVEELKGDIYLSKDDSVQARKAYSAASVAAKRMNKPRPILELKLDDLAVSES